MHENYCKDCQVEGIPDEVPNRWRCPECGRTILALTASDEVKATEALGMQGASDERRGDFPLREFARHLAGDGTSSAIDIERLDNGLAKTLRSRQPACAAPRDAGGERKHADELEAVRVLLPFYNKQHGTSYQVVDSAEDARGDDVTARSPNANEPVRRFQVTFADRNGRL